MPLSAAAEDSGRRLGVLGWPVAHSLSPAMQNAALAALGLHRWRYQLLPVPPDALAETVRALPAAGFAGANVTIPHKEAALALADRQTQAARAIGAANTLVFSADGIEADNTDAPGLLATLPEPPAGRSAQVLGAGGSARAVTWALCRGGAREVMVWNRTAQRARELAEAMGARAVQRPEPADVLVNCTSVGLDGGDLWNELGLTPSRLGDYGCVVDLVYGAAETELLGAARAAGADTVDGLEVLVCQGALSLKRWTGLEVPIDAMRAALARPPRQA